MKIKNTILFSLIATFFLIFLVSIWKVLATLQGLTIKTFNIEIIFIIGFLISLFHLIFNDKIYSDTCDKQDDIWFYIVRILNDIKCYITLKKWHTKDISAIGLYSVFNSKNNNNTLSFTKTIQKLKELHYM